MTGDDRGAEPGGADIVTDLDRLDHPPFPFGTGRVEIPPGGVYGAVDVKSLWPPGERPPELRLVFLQARWSPQTMAELRRVVVPAAEALRACLGHANLWGPSDGLYAATLWVDMANKLGAMVDAADSLGIPLGSGRLAGWLLAPESGQSWETNIVAQCLIDLYRTGSDLLHWGYVRGAPSPDRPADLDDRLVAQLADIADRLGRYLSRAQHPAKPPTPCEADIIQTLREVGCRLTTSQLLTELSRRGRLHGTSTVRKALADMVDSQRLTNKQDCMPKGYGLPDWHSD
jgi:hypothetical protein